MDYGVWTENSRDSYNRWDAVARCTTQVYPGAWTAIFVSLDNVGMWNLRTQNLDRWYLGQEVYMRIVNPEDTGDKTEIPLPDNALILVSSILLGSAASSAVIPLEGRTRLVRLHGSGSASKHFHIQIFIIVVGKFEVVIQISFSGHYRSSNHYTKNV